MPSINDKPLGYRLKDEESEFLRRLGQRIVKIRVKHNLSQAEYACILSIGSKRLARIELGEVRPSIKLLFKIENHFEVKKDWLMTGRGRIFEKENWKEPIEQDLQFMKMFNRLEDEGKEKMLNVIKVFLKNEHFERQGLE